MIKLKDFFKVFTILVIIISTQEIIAQELEPTKSMDGVYYTTFAEKGVKGKTNTMLVQLAENNGVKMAAVAACEKCFPAIYSYKLELSKVVNKPAFYNSMGLYFVTYDENSFICFMPGTKGNKDFVYINFFSKDENKAKAMTKDKMIMYAEKI
ncbi:hypothetical protein [Tenacibaculum crassostreae]|uniref:hypothetical protein n=1 Tax=Tenacibaculum crassostreae TaxID=502683 RepID=UPI0038966B5E